MENGPTQAVLPLVGLAAEKVIRDRDRYKVKHGSATGAWPRSFPKLPLRDDTALVCNINVGPEYSCEELAVCRKSATPGVSRPIW
ncbi:MAG: hypothetical protein ACQESR_06595 [Planctomycetota bacterium]